MARDFGDDGKTGTLMLSLPNAMMITLEATLRKRKCSVGIKLGRFESQFTSRCLNRQ